MKLLLNPIFDCLTRFLLFLHFSRKRIARLKGIHSAETIYILASGPSLIGKDLDFLSSEIVIAVNGSFSALNSISFRNIYWVMSDTKRLSSFSCVDRSQFNQSFCYLTPNGSFINPFSISPSDIVIPALRKNSYKQSKVSDLPFPPDLMSGSFSSGAGSSIFNAIELAIFFGASNIILFGCDFQAPISGPSHFVEYQLKLPPQTSYSELISSQFISKIRPALKFYNDYCNLNCINLYNSSTSTSDDLTAKLPFGDLPIK